LANRSTEPYIEEGIDALSLMTPLLEKRRLIIGGAILIALLVGAWAAIKPRKFRAELAITPVTSTRSPQALGGLAALAGATIQMGYQLTPARMVEFLKMRSVLAGVGMSKPTPTSTDRVVDRVLGEHYDPTEADNIAKQIAKLMNVTANKETGTITLSIQHKDSALARMIASRIVDSASQVFVRTSRAQAQQLRMAQEDRVTKAAAALAMAEETLRQFNFANRSTPAYSVAGLERDRLNRQIQFAEQVYTQAMTERDQAYARELEATPTVVIQDPLPATLPKVRKRIILKTAIAGVTSFVMLCVVVLLLDLMNRRLAQPDSESARFRSALATLPRLKSQRQHAG
jgi:uncharacterized protein involved in exopolysaccharide biosynthesis